MKIFQMDNNDKNLENISQTKVKFSYFYIIREIFMFRYLACSFDNYFQTFNFDYLSIELSKLL